ncbi:unnamed protein product [Phytophthora fragariaefolia]|uniref:Unnamed protein product n=1 Tax=Phytophthora fragariaefolia TaxID=1490495 RepID=A0A9W6XM95_9STRA|nr:unnamed protein product [Phytophthora fragariaefolia]
MAPNREICAFFYEEKVKGDYRCRLCGASRKQSVGSGCGNLLSHLNSTHPDFEETYQASVVTNSPLSSFGFVSEATHHRYQWLQWVVEQNMPISEVDDPLTRSMSSWKPVASKTLKLDMQTCYVGRTVEKELEEVFGVTWDGWSHGTDNDVEEFIPTGSTHKKLLDLLEEPKKLDSVCRTLQGENTSMVDVRVLFDHVAVYYPGMASHLRPSARIVHDPAFEATLVKITNKVKLTASEAHAVQRFVMDPPVTSGKRKDRSTSDYASEILRGEKKVRASGDASVTYGGLAKVVPPTSNTVERLFSQCKFVLTPQRPCMLPANFDMLAFLRANRDLWNATSFLAAE